MGFSLIAASAIIGVSALMAIEIIVGTVIPSITDVNNSFDDVRNRAIEKIKTDINVTGVSTEINETKCNISITVKNTGSVTLETKYFDILLNGTKTEFTCSKSYLYPEDEVYFNVSDLQGSGERRLKVVTNNGVEEYYEFMLS